MVFHDDYFTLFDFVYTEAIFLGQFFSFKSIKPLRVKILAIRTERVLFINFEARDGEGSERASLTIRTDNISPITRFPMRLLNGSTTGAAGFLRFGSSR